MSVFGDIRQTFRNVRDDLAALHLPLLGNPPSVISIAKTVDYPLRELDRVLARVSSNNYQIEASESDIRFEIADPRIQDGSYSAMVLSKYLVRACNGEYGSLGGLAPVEFPLPVYISAPPVLCNEFKADKSLTGDDRIFSFKIQEVAELATFRKFSAFDSIRYEELVDVLERKAELEVNFPKIEFVLTNTAQVISAITRRIQLDLNIRVSKAPKGD